MASAIFGVEMSGNNNVEFMKLFVEFINSANLPTNWYRRRPSFTCRGGPSLWLDRMAILRSSG